MTTYRTHDDRFRVCVCWFCDVAGPPRPKARDAKQAARDAGWSRRYYGVGEAFVCPECRVTHNDRGKGGER